MSVPPDPPRRSAGRYWMIAFWVIVAFVLLMWFVPELL